MTPTTLTARWLQIVASHDVSGIDTLLADDAVFRSPAIHKPQHGKALVATYLRAALVVLNNATFRYTGEWLAERSAVLEFELALDGLDVNGVDIIKWNDAGLITEFKVMVRPVKALNAVIARMAAQLQTPSA